ncbi:cytochrome b5-related protein-like isoform X4 [Periplaneta americana]|uniref:cytochrome b5-related protein-like isoform X4 n=1 Tax=Periplaneta americana TaxID=6978 RepID=UPI0037E9C00F
MSPRGSDLSPSSLPGLWRSPSYRRSNIRTVDLWLEGKRTDDDTDGLWRIHDNLYDLSAFIHVHPGGSDWLQYSKGTDITEAFESHHVKTSVRNYLKHYYVRPATGRRFSPYTFHEDGFFRTLKRRAQPIIEKVPTGPALRSKIWMDMVMVTTLATASLATGTHSYTLGVLAGFLMTLTVMGAHNFLHLRNNVRMYYFDISFMSCRDWRISHALSHHMFPNTLLDIELCFNEKIFQWLPLKNKSWCLRYGSWFYGPVFYAGLYFLSYLQRIHSFLSGNKKALRLDIIIPFIPLLVMYTTSGATFRETFLMWIWIVGVSSFIFGFLGFNGAHHHPDIFHDGDTPRCQMISFSFVQVVFVPRLFLAIFHVRYNPSCILISLKLFSLDNINRLIEF